MDPTTAFILTSIASGILGNFSTDAVKAFFSAAFTIKPELEDRLRSAQSSVDFEAIFREAVGVIDANAGSGKIHIDGGLLQAIRGIRFDHQHGTINIAGTTISSAVLVTGGGNGSSGTTVIGGNTIMKSGGTSINVGDGCSIVMTGSSSIKQT